MNVKNTSIFISLNISTFFFISLACLLVHRTYNQLVIWFTKIRRENAE